MNAWLIRHGQSTNNAGLPATDYAAVPLTELGRRQAEALADAFAKPPAMVVVSPFLRSQATAEPLRARWPDLPCETWRIEEFTYLSPRQCVGSTADGRRAWAGDYWRRADPHWRHADDAETFSEFAGRLGAFHAALGRQGDRFLAIFGHGQFFRAYMLALETGFEVDPAWMRRFRAEETRDPLANAERIVVRDGKVVARRTLHDPSPPQD